VFHTLEVVAVEFTNQKLQEQHLLVELVVEVELLTPMTLELQELPIVVVEVEEQVHAQVHLL
tara:strand:- start:81 stop:266 length:186 start_codon:yes stop_codon:yes gene_type:complete